MAGELDALMAQFQLSDEERRRLLLGNALLGLGAGLAGGKPGDWLGSAAGGLATGAGLGQRAISNAREDKAAEFKMREYAEGKAAAKAQAEQQERMRQEVGALFSGASTPEQYIQAAAYYAANGDTKRAKEMHDIAQQMRPKYSQSPQVGVDPSTGQPYQFVLDDSGNEKRLAAGVKPDFADVDLGGSRQFVNKYNIPASGQTFAKTPTPGDAQRQTQWEAEQALRVNADKRAAASAAQGKAPAFSAEAGGFVYPPSAENPTGRVVPPAGYTPKQKELTESQGQASMYLGMMTSASADLAKNKMPDMGNLAAARGDMPFINKNIQNWMASPAAQQYTQSSLQWTEAMLRITTGATAPPEEVLRTAKTFFPQIGDSKAVIAQKEEKRKQMEQFVRIKAGAGSGQVDALTGGGGTIDFSRLNP